MLLALPWCALAVYAASTLAALLFARFALDRHADYYSAAYDFGFFDQIVWNTAHGRWFETSFVDYNFLGQHVEPVLLLFAAAYRLGAGPEFLLVTQAAFAAAAAVPLFHATRAFTGSGLIAMLLAAAYLLNPSLHNALDFDFHPELLAFFFAFLALQYVALDRPRGAAAAVLPVLMLKEDMALIVLAFGALMWVRGRRRPGQALAGIAVAWGLATILVLQPLIRGGGSDLSKRFSYLVEDASPLTLVPLALWRGGAHLATETAPAFASMVVSTGGLALLHPAALLAVPSAAMNGLADHGPQARLDLQYAAAPLALLFVSSALSTGWLARRRRGAFDAATVMTSIAVLSAAASFLLLSPYSPAVQRFAPSEAHRSAIDAALRLVPADASVSAQNTLLPHLSHRRDVYEFPHLKLHNDVVVLDMRLPITAEARPALSTRVGELPSLGFRQVFSRDGVAVWKRDIVR